MKFEYCHLCKDTGRFEHLVLGEVPCSCLESPSNPKMAAPEKRMVYCSACKTSTKLGSVHHCQPLPQKIEYRTPNSDKEASREPIPFAWESMGPTASRARVWNGWVMRIYAADKAEGAHIFIADANHDWKIEEPPPNIVEGRPCR